MHIGDCFAQPAAGHEIAGDNLDVARERGHCLVTENSV
jgi:hypothetical protein